MSAETTLTLRGSGGGEGVQGFLKELRLGLDLGRRRMLQMAQDRLNYMSEGKICEDQGRVQRTKGCSLGNEWEGGQRRYVTIRWSPHPFFV